MDYGFQAQPSHYSAPPTHYSPSTSSAGIIGPPPNPNPSFDQVPLPLPPPQGIDPSLTAPVGYTVPHPITYDTYQASMSAAPGHVSIAAPYIGPMPTINPVPLIMVPSKPKYTPMILYSAQVKKKKHRATAEELEAKKQKLIETGADANSIRTCTVCNVACNNDKVFAFHIASEKHISRVNGKPYQGLTVYSANMSTPNKKYKTKKTNVLGAVKNPTVAQSVYCDICKITCNTQEMYNNHVAGKKHNKNIKNLTAGDKQNEFVPETSTLPGTQTPGTSDSNNKFVYCDICKITCNTLEVYNNHLSGKKHNKKIKALTIGDNPLQFVPETSTIPGSQTTGTNSDDQERLPTNSQIEPKPSTKNKSGSKEDLETKKRKVLESGAKGDAVKVCDLCNIVCNGPTVFEYHCKGQKHRSMVKKQEENPGGSAVAHYTAPPVVVAAPS